MADILRFPGAWKIGEHSVDNGAIGSVIAKCIDSVIHAVRAKRLTINLQLDPDIAASTSHADFQPAIAETLQNATARAPDGSVIDILGSRTKRSIEIEVSDLGDSAHIALNNSMHRPYEVDSVVQQSIRLPQGGTSTILRICRPMDAVLDAAEAGENSTVAAFRKAA